MEQLENNVVVITGASRGLGRVLTKNFVLAGAKVIAVARSKEKLNLLADQLNSAGKKVFPIKVDIRHVEEIQELYRFCCENFDHIDILVNNAAVWTGDKITDVSSETINNVIDTGLTGTLLMAYFFLPHFIGQKKGHIINISALVGKPGHPRSVPYTSTKHAIRGFSEQLGKEMRKQGVAVTCICPGSISPIEDEKVTPHILKSLRGFVQVTYQDVADSVIFVAKQPFPKVVDEIVIRSVAERVGPKSPSIIISLELLLYLFLTKLKKILRAN